MAAKIHKSFNIVKLFSLFFAPPVIFRLKSITTAPATVVLLQGEAAAQSKTSCFTKNRGSF